MDFDNVADFVRDQVQPVLHEHGIRLDTHGSQIRMMMPESGYVIIPFYANNRVSEFLVVYEHESGSEILKHARMLIEVINTRRGQVFDGIKPPKPLGSVSRRIRSKFSLT